MIRPFAMRVVFCILLLACVPAAAQTLPADKLEKIDKEITAAMSQQSIPGLSVAVVTDHKLRGSQGYGLADLENYVPAKAGTVYRLGSISKTITAIAVMQLAEQGKLKLDAPIQTYCPAFPQKQWPVTARLLLGHLAGVRHYKSDAEYANTRHFNSIVEGRPNGMPNFSGKIPEYQVWQLVAYVRSMSGQLPKDISPSRDDRMMAKQPESSTPAEHSPRERPADLKPEYPH